MSKLVGLTMYVGVWRGGRQVYCCCTMARQDLEQTKYVQSCGNVVGFAGQQIILNIPNGDFAAH